MEGNFSKASQQSRAQIHRMAFQCLKNLQVESRCNYSKSPKEF